MTIRPTDRISTVIARDERLVEVLASAAPAFTRLRSPMMRKTMARLVTVEQAARMAGVEVDALVALLNRSLKEAAADVDRSDPHAEAIASGDAAATVESVGAGKDTAAGASVASAEAGNQHGVAHGKEEPMSKDRDDTTGVAEPMPAALADVAPEHIVDADVRDDLRRGEEPFRKIMDARRRRPRGGVLRVRAIFEPIPLYAVMARQGLAHWTEQLADDDWRVWFYSDAEVGATAEAEAYGGESAAAAAAPSSTAAHGAEARDATATPGDDVVVLDVRGMEPPEPMVHTLEALERLPAGQTLVQINVRVPQFLLSELEARGFSYEVREQEPGLVRVFIRRSAQGA